MVTEKMIPSKTLRDYCNEHNIEVSDELKGALIYCNPCITFWDKIEALKTYCPSIPKSVQETFSIMQKAWEEFQGKYYEEATIYTSEDAHDVYDLRICSQWRMEGKAESIFDKAKELSLTKGIHHVTVEVENAYYYFFLSMYKGELYDLNGGTSGRPHSKLDSVIIDLPDIFHHGEKVRTIEFPISDTVFPKEGEIYDPEEEDRIKAYGEKGYLDNYSAFYKYINLEYSYNMTLLEKI